MIKLTQKDRTYRLKNGQKPLTFTIPSRNHPRFPLLWFDKENNQNRALRYAINQNSPFEDEQDGNAILDPITFEDGLLHVPMTNPVLQIFLYIHPMNNVLFEEVDNEKIASNELENFNIEVDAMIEARQLTVEQLESVYRVLYGKDPSTVTTAEIRRDVIIAAKRDPKGFVNMIKDPMLSFNSKVRVFFESKLLTMRNNDKEVWFNTPSNKRKMLAVPFGHDPYETVALYLKTDEGIEALKFLESQL